VKVLAIDYGTKRIGVAVSDPDGIFALALRPIQADSPDRALEAIADRIQQERPDRVVVGLPLRMDGTEGEAVERVRALVAELAARVEPPIDLFDERLTSAEARGRLRGVGLSRRRKRAAVNTVSAQIILQSYLDARRARDYNESERP
jgi:putative Holliday junction resolvase